MYYNLEILIKENVFIYEFRIVFLKLVIDVFCVFCFIVIF